MKQYYIIKFNDLRAEKQTEIKEGLKAQLRDDRYYQEQARQRLDPQDDMFEHIEGAVEWACDRSWVEWEILI